MTGEIIVYILLNSLTLRPAISDPLIVPGLSVGVGVVLHCMSQSFFIHTLHFEHKTCRIFGLNKAGLKATMLSFVES